MKDVFLTPLGGGSEVRRLRLQETIGLLVAILAGFVQFSPCAMAVPVPGLSVHAGCCCNAGASTCTCGHRGCMRSADGEQNQAAVTVAATTLSTAPAVVAAESVPTGAAEPLPGVSVAYGAKPHCTLFAVRLGDRSPPLA